MVMSVPHRGERFLPRSLRFLQQRSLLVVGGDAEEVGAASVVEGSSRPRGQSRRAAGNSGVSTTLRRQGRYLGSLIDVDVVAGAEERRRGPASGEGPGGEGLFDFEVLPGGKLEGLTDPLLEG